jgi:membrane fusion protein (multidrug efflux system)
MAEVNKLTLASVAVAVVCAGWAVYATKHADKPSASFGPPGMGAAAPPGRPGAPAGPPGAGRPGAMAGGLGGGVPVPVKSVVVEERELARELRALGSVRANEAVEITAKAPNLVAAVRFRDGQRVARGDVLVELDSAQARADLAAATAALTESTSQYERSRELLPTQALSKSQFDQIDAARKANQARVDAARARLEDTVIRAPFSGRVGLRRVSVGSLIAPGTVITTLDDTSVMKLDFPVPENDLTALREDLPVVARSTAYPDRGFTGRVTSVDSRVDPDTRSITVRAALPNPDDRLKPGMFMTVTLERDQRRAVSIPEEALVPEQQRQYVFVAAEGRAVRREVRIGARRPGSVEITEGLTPGERVVIEGTVRLRDGSTINDLAAGGAPPAAPGAAVPPAGARG